MRNNVLDVLRYLFEGSHGTGIEAITDEQQQQTVVDQLQEMGFDGRSIYQAFDWIQNLSFLDGVDDGDVGSAQRGIRYYTNEEIQHLPARIRGYIMGLEQVGILDTVSREMVINQLMFLEPESIELDSVKWVTLVVLDNYPAGLGLTLTEENMVVEGKYRSMH
ncbi:MAG: DUF494 domain-containing protein [Gammaproteobacteria bacterium]|nr:DUF494 domain-containing protein [Gammaproteobacteria bacterium]